MSPISHQVAGGELYTGFIPWPGGWEGKALPTSAEVVGEVIKNQFKTILWRVRTD